MTSLIVILLKRILNIFEFSSVYDNKETVLAVKSIKWKSYYEQ
jgi:hypothetical protein